MSSEDSAESMLPKAVQMNDSLEQPGEVVYPSNAVHSHRYTLLNFLPLQVYEQLNPFKKFANFYFLVVGCLQAVPQISVTGGLPVTLGPLLFVLGVDALTKLYEDWQRRRSDALTNSEATRVLDASTGAFEPHRWDEVRVGDVVCVRNREIFPADMLFLGTGSGSSASHCWVSTKSLDGETDSKLREAAKATFARLSAAGCDACATLLRLRGALRCEAPNGNCNDFAGMLHLEPDSERGSSAPADVSAVTEGNMLLRGCQLRNTEQIFGLVVSTGVDTKAMSAGGARGGGSALSSSAEKVGAMTGRMNRDILGICAMLAALSVLGAVLHALWRDGEAIDGGFWYLGAADLCENPAELMGSYFLLSYTFIPVSLYVSINLVYTATAFFMAQDLAMYDPTLDQPAEVRTMSLCDELGRISHVLSDKTGTLTSNHMRLRRLTVGEVLFGEPVERLDPLGASGGSSAHSLPSAGDGEGGYASESDVAPPRALRMASGGAHVAPHADRQERQPHPKKNEKMNEKSLPGTQLQGTSLSHLGGGDGRFPPLPAHFGCRPQTAEHVCYEEAEGVRGVSSLYASLDDLREANAAWRNELVLLLLHLAVNHSVLYEALGGAEELSASSPDELALVSAHFGFDFTQRDLSEGVLLVREKRLGAA
ncbi:hypothetical protein T492DRAFT_880973 [Pavlovales sp. CCMP2436]|nr:hypothetical protein T492DRAFT_880973 [Pavlovales sp. CCMP2436]